MVNLQKYGFELIRSKRLDEIDATLYEMEHVKSGAGLIYLDRDDENKTFSIGFSTPPSNDTGVFHIIEHSVLCGSKKFPLKDPFTELLKGSLNTFLNALTYEDRTIYPVSSRCEKDFINLVDVYMDAVLSPNMLTNQNIFRQEGWHYEYDEESDTLSYNGVVYNEMRGAYSSPDELGGIALMRALYEGTPYQYDSGGNPDFIPNLTYDALKAAHKKHYHPSNAKIFLDGKMNLDNVLSLLNSHLDAYERAENVSLNIPPVKNPPSIQRIGYEISENENEKGKARVLYGYVYGGFDDRETQLTVSILADVLCGSNASALKKALLEKGLAKDAAMYAIKSREQTVVIEIRDADEDRIDEIDATVDEVIKSLCENGIEKEKLSSVLNSIEFRTKERDLGTLPTGIAFAMSVYGSWLHGAPPENALLSNDILKAIRDKIDTSHFESTLCDMILSNERKAKVIMLPDKTLGEKNAEAERERLARVRASLSAEELNKIISEQSELKKWQGEEDSEEAIDSLPKLLLSDIPSDYSRPRAVLQEENDVKILKCDVKTNGIVYISLLFEAADLCKEELIDLSILSSALTNFPTGKQDVLSLQNDIKSNLGSFFSSFSIGTRNGTAIPYLKIGASALSSKKNDMLRITEEVLLGSIIENEKELCDIVMQMKANLENAIIASGEGFAISRVESSLDDGAAIDEYLSGYEAYARLCKICKNETELSVLPKRISNLLMRLCDRRRLTIMASGEYDDSLISSFLSLFPEEEKDVESGSISCHFSKSEFILTPSKVAYAVIGGKSDRIKDNLGILRVARSILSYEYLWNTVRVQGGAYGTGFVPKRCGTLVFYSYRDPSPASSLDYYRQGSAYLRSLAESETDISKFIIGAIGEYDMIITPRTATMLALTDYLNGRGADEDRQIREQMLNMTAKDLITAADIIDEALENESLAIVGGAEHLKSLNTQPERIIKI